MSTGSRVGATSGDTGQARGRGAPSTGATAPGPGRTDGRVSPVAVAALFGAVVGLAQYLLVRRALVDDAYITLTYARNLGLHGYWGLLDGVTSNTETSPAFVLVLGLVTAVVRSAVVALGVVLVGAGALLAASMAGVARALGLPVVLAWVAVVLVALNPLLLSSTGLETQQLVALLAALLWAGVSGRGVWFGLLAGALVLTRVDAGVLVAVLALGLVPVLRRLHVAVPVAVLVVLPWYLFSWYHLGSAIPDTLVLKQDETWGRYSFGNGLDLYLDHYPLATWLSVALPIAGVLAAVVLLVLTAARRTPWRRSGPWVVLAVAGAAHYGAYSTLDVPPFHWYYGASFGALTLAAVGGWATVLATAAGEHPARARRGVVRGLGAAATAVVVVVQGGYAVAHGLPWSQAPIMTNWAEPAQYLAIGHDLARTLPAGDVVRSPGEVGTLEYSCGCVVDLFADRYRLLPVIDRSLATSTGLSHDLLELNYRHLRRPTAPIAFQYTMYHAGPVPAPPAAVESWPVDSRWLKAGSFVLDRAPAAPAPAAAP